MKPEYLNALKSGYKTAVIAFVVSLVGLLTTAMDGLISWQLAGNPPDLNALRGLALGAIISLALGIGNTTIRFVQVAAVPFIGAFFDKIIGAVPSYQPPVGPVDEIGEDDNTTDDLDAGPVPEDHL